MTIVLVEPWVGSWRMRVLLVINGSILLSYPCINIHRSIVSVDWEIKYSCSSLHKFRSIGTKARFATIRKVDSIVCTPKICAVISTGRCPCHSSHLFKFREKSSIQSLAIAIVSLLTMNLVVVHKSHMFLQSMMHECNTIWLWLIIISDHTWFVLKPLDLISSYTVHTSCTHAIVSSSTEEPKTSLNFILIIIIPNWNLICKLMVHVSSVVLVWVIPCHWVWCG